MKYNFLGLKMPNHPVYNSIIRISIIFCFLFQSLAVCAQTVDTNKLVLPILRDSTKGGSIEYLTVKQCVDYALKHQPYVNIAAINIDVARETNGVNLAAWLPQVNVAGSFEHQIQQAPVNSNANTGGFKPDANSFVPTLSVTQAIFSPALLLAGRSAPLYVKQAQQVSDSTKIGVVANVAKAFYNVLLTLEQINVLKEDTARLGKNLRDAYHQYKGGIVDETDYLEAGISLNNSQVSLKQANENVVPLYASLKRLMGYPPEQQFNVSFDTLQMMQDIHIDTTEQLRYEKRIEYQALATSKALQNQLVNYYRTEFLPTLSGFFDYNLNFQSNTLPQIFSSSYPTSVVGLTVSIPIFTGFARIHNLRKARLQDKIIDYQGLDLKSQIYSEYTTALANYKSNLYNLQLSQKNVAMAKRVYFVVTLQYKQGIVAYLNVITAESNLITSETTYLNALFQVLSNKIDLEKAMGNITY